MGGFEADETVAVEAWIAEELLRLTRGRRVGSQVVPPAPYVRRHAVEHAAAGQTLDERTCRRSPQSVLRELGRRRKLDNLPAPLRDLAVAVAMP